MDPYRFLFVLKDSNKSQWLLIGLYVSLLILMHCNGSLLVLISSHASL